MLISLLAKGLDRTIYCPEDQQRSALMDAEDCHDVPCCISNTNRDLSKLYSAQYLASGKLSDHFILLSFVICWYLLSERMETFVWDCSESLTADFREPCPETVWTRVESFLEESQFFGERCFPVFRPFLSSCRNETERSGNFRSAPTERTFRQLQEGPNELWRIIG